MRTLLLFSFILGLNHSAISQENEDTTKTPKNTKFILPLVFYSPETRWGFGIATFYAFRFNGEPDSSRPSQIQLGGAYTLNNQVLTYLPFQLYFNKEMYTTYGEFGYYIYNYLYYGVGIEQTVNAEEVYGVDYPRVRLTFLKRFFPNLYAGLRFNADDYKITELDSTGALQEHKISGSRGGFNSGAGFVLNYDSRDNYFASQNGWFAELSFLRYGNYVGSSFSYSQINLDVRKFFSLSKKDVLAVQAWSQAIYGEAPFIALSLLGGNKRMRGLYEGRYRDEKSAILQAEYRRDLFWKIGAVAFADAGTVAPEFSDMSLGNIKTTYGVGLRFKLNEKDHINIRLDAGFTEGKSGYYLTVGEAF